MIVNEISLVIQNRKYWNTGFYSFYLFTPLGHWKPGKVLSFRFRPSASLLFSFLFLLLSFFFLFNPLGTRERRRGKRRGGLGSSPIFSNLSGLRLGLEQAGNPFCLLINSSWLLVFISLFYLLLMGLNLYWWKGIHFS